MPPRSSIAFAGIFVLSLVLATGCRDSNPAAPGAGQQGPLQIAFQTRSDIETSGASVRSFLVDDFTRDGTLDILVASWAERRIRLLVGLTGGGFSTTSGWTKTFASLPGEFVRTDLTGDGVPDFACLFAQEGVVRLYGNDGNGSFTEQAASLRAGLFSCGLTAADLDGDGDDELLFCDNFGENLVLHYARGDGTFAAPVALAPGPGSDLSDVVAADVSGDGRSDLVACDIAQARVHIWVQQADATFASPRAIALAPGAAPLSVAVQDVNADQLADVCVASFAARSVTVLLGSGGGAFQSPSVVEVDGAPGELCVGDTDRDGTQDLVVSYIDHAAIGVLSGDGKGGFGSERQFGSSGLPTQCRLVDLDADGSVDVLTSGMDGTRLSWHRGAGDTGLGVATDYRTGHNSPRFVTSTDLDGDGRDDVIVSHFEAGFCSVLRGTQSGALELMRADIAVGPEPNHVASGDFDRDGKRDVVVSVAGGLRFLLNRSTAVGEFAFETQPPLAEPPFAAGDGPFVTLCAKFDGDDIDDLAVADSGGGRVRVLKGRASGFGFESTGTSVPIGGGPLGLAAGDFNADGNHDLAVSRFNLGLVGILDGDGNGGFEVPKDLLSGPSPNYIRSADFDGNGVPDLIVSNLGTAYLTMFLAESDGTGFRKQLIVIGQSPAALLTEDINDDGNVDILVTNYLSADFHVVLGNGTGGFSTSARFPSTFGAISASLGDTNGDGRPDLLMTSLRATRVSQYLNRSVR